MQGNNVTKAHTIFSVTLEGLYKYLIKPILHVIQYLSGMAALISVCGMFFTFPVAIVIVISLLFTGTATHMEYLWMFLISLAVAVVGIAIMVGCAFIDDDFI